MTRTHKIYTSYYQIGPMSISGHEPPFTCGVPHGYLFVYQEYNFVSTHSLTDKLLMKI